MQCPQKSSECPCNALFPQANIFLYANPQLKAILEPPGAIGGHKKGSLHVSGGFLFYALLCFYPENRPFHEHWRSLFARQLNPPQHSRSSCSACKASRLPWKNLDNRDIHYSHTGSKSRLFWDMYPYRKHKGSWISSFLSIIAPSFLREQCPGALCVGTPFPNTLA